MSESAVTVGMGFGIGVAILFFIDIVFYFYVRICILPALQRKKQRHPPLMLQPEQAFRRFVTQIKELETYSFQKYCSGFFLNAKFEDIKTKNFDSFIAWTIFAKELEGLNDDELDKVFQVRKEILEYFSIDMEEGYNPHIRHVTVDFDNVKHSYRPVILYLLLNVIELFSNLRHLVANGYVRYHCNKLSYWYREGKDKTKPPIILFHGICSGWSYYADTIRILGENRTVILVDCRFVKLNWISLYVPDPWTFNETILEILNRHNIIRCSVIAHSWGTFLAGWFVKQSPQLIDHLTLIDPVSVTFLFPETTYIIVYKVSETVEDKLLEYFVRHDVSVSNTIHRNFTWYNEALHFRDIPKPIRITISASTDDALVCFEVLAELIEKENSSNRLDNPIHLIRWDNFKHGQVISTKPALEAIHDALI